MGVMFFFNGLRITTTHRRQYLQTLGILGAMFLALCMFPAISHAQLATQEYRYYDENRPQMAWSVPVVLFGATVQSYHQRIELRADAGIMDSIAVLVDSISSGAVLKVAIWSDVVVSTEFPFNIHYPDFFTMTAPLWETQIPASKVSRGAFTSIPIPQISIQKNIHVVLACIGENERIVIRGDRKVPYPLSVNSVFTSLRAYFGTQPVIAPLSGIVKNEAGTEIFSDLYVKAWVSEPVGVAGPLASTLDVEVYPNPVNTGAPIAISLPSSLAGQSLHFTLYDALGRIAHKSESVQYSGTPLWVRPGSLAPGVYYFVADRGTVRLASKAILVR